MIALPLPCRSALLIAALCLAAPAAAEPPAGPPGDGSCRDEIQALCPHEPGDRRAAFECVQERRDELSPECRERMEEGRARLRGRMGALREACAEDAETYCPDVSFGGGRVARCLEDHADAISKSCYDALGELRSAREKRRR